MKVQSISKLMKRLWWHVWPDHRNHFILVISLMIIASLTEMFSIGMVLPFVSILINPNHVFEHPQAQWFVYLFGFTNASQLLFPLTLLFGMLALLTGLVRLVMVWQITRLSYSVGTNISMKIYSRTLYQSYSVHCARNSSEIIDGISNKASITLNIISLILTLISSFFIIISILVVLIWIQPTVAILTFAGFGSIYLLTIRITRKRLLSNSLIVARESSILLKSVQEALGGIRDVLIDGSQDAYCKVYSNSDSPLKRVQGNSSFISVSPRYIIEAFGMFFIAFLAYFLSLQGDGILGAMSIIAALALGAQRLLPVLQQSYAAWSYILSAQISLHDTLELLDQALPEYFGLPAPYPLPFNRQIFLKGVSFRYSNQDRWVIRNLDLTIDKGSRVGFIGKTGSGKSTLLDIVMALLHPSEGLLIIDNEPITTANYRSWQVRLAHVPQAIFLADASIESNIAIGVPSDKIDHERVRKAAEQAKISESIESWPEKYQTMVGERGIRLSGGQRQRIGIARALYKRADVIIFDEATSALDNDTELSVMQAIEGLSKDITLLIIAHRLTTLRTCKQIVELDNGGIKLIGSYDDIAARGG
jgi:ABC-type multidrug transport system fused ATPase/permease subunit